MIIAAIALTASIAQAQQSNGLTFYHLADSNSKDGNGNTLTSIKPGPQTDGNMVAFESGSATTACDSAASLYSAPISGGSVSTLAGPGIQAEPSEPSGTTTVVCNHLVLSGSTLFYPANYTPTGGSQRSGIFKLPIAGGASADVLATGDATPMENFQTSGGTRVTQPGTVASVATTTFSVDPSASLIADYTANFTAGGPYSFNTINLYGYPPLLGGPGLSTTTTCPGVTVPVQGGSVSSGLTVGMESGYAENAPWYADIISGTGTNYLGATVDMQFLRIAIWPYGGCSSVVFGPDLGSLNGRTTFILPGEPLPNTATPVSTMSMGTVAVSNGVVYLSATQLLSATQGTYSGFFTVADNFTGSNGSNGAFPLPNGQWPQNLNPIPTKIISNYDPVPGITLGLATCPGGVSQIPAMSTFFTVNGNYLVFGEVQTLQDCTTMATSTAGGIYAYNLTTKAVQLVVPYGASLVSGDPSVTALTAILPGSLSADGHLALVVSNTGAGSSTSTQILYSTYLPQLVTAVSLTTSGSTTNGGTVALTAKVSPNSGAANQATGSVRFMDGATILGTQAIDSTGTATLSVTTLSNGSHTLQAVYTGDALYEGATSGTVSLANGKATPVLTLASASTIFQGQSITLTAQLSAAAGTPTGQIVFASGGASLGSAPISSGGSASLVASALPLGTDQIVATYAGDSNFNAAVSAPDSVLVLVNSGVNLTPYTLTFPTQAVGTTSAAQVLTLSNFTGNPLPVGSITVSGDFAQTNTCSTAGPQCFINVTFSPKTAGQSSGIVTVTGNGSGTQTVALTGTTLPAAIGATTTTIISSGTTGDYTLTGTVVGVRNTDVPTSTVSFVDASNNNLSLGTATLGAAAPGFSLAVLSPPSSGMGPNAIALGDFNGDGKMDIATTNSGGSVGIRTAGGPPGILLGNGDGTFTAGTTPETPTHALTIAAADFNGDGKLDLVVDGGTGGALIILLGNGDGTFTPASTPVTSFDPAFVTTGDFNGDGKMDIAALNDTDNTVVVLLGNGDATFTQAAAYPAGQYPSFIAIADFNHDGKSDLAVQNSGDGSITILLGVGDGTFTSAPTVAAQQTASQLVSGDFNGDGKPDLAMSFQDSSNNYANTLMVFLGNGDGTFQSVSSPATDSGTENDTLTAADFNGDGKSDLVFADDNNVSILLSKGDGTFTLAASAPGATTAPSYFSVATGDFNGDGVPDIAAADGDLSTVGILLTQRTQTAVATLGNISIPGAGTHNILAAYEGDTNFSASSSSVISLTASQVATSLQLSSSSGSSTLGAQITLTATLSPYSAGSLATNGEAVTFYNNGTSIGTGTLTSGVAILNTTSLPVGNNSVTATYAGDSSFASSTAAAVPVVITASVTPVPAVTLSPTTLTFASQTLGVTSAAQSITLTNSGQASLLLTSIASSGDFAETNNCGTSVASGASCAIAVTFTPTAAGSRTGTLTITDNASGSPQTVALSGGGAAIVSLSPGSTSLTIGATGGTTTTTIQISPVSGFTGAINLTCAVSFLGQGTPTDPPTCSLTPAQVQITGSTPASATLTISTTLASSMAKPEKDFNPALTALAGLLFLGIVPRRRWRRAALFAGLCFITLGGAIGCGSSHPSGTSNPPGLATTAGNYQVAVTATSGASKVTSNIPLTIQ